MLTRLQIENVAVIEKAEICFEDGLNVLTGETGAGKSILIDSINAILGNRASRDLIRTGTDKAVIRAAFESIPDSVADKLEQAGYDRENDLLLVPLWENDLPREWNACHGRSDARFVHRTCQHSRTA